MTNNVMPFSIQRIQVGMIPRDERELLEQIIEEFDEAVDLGLVVETCLRKHPAYDIDEGPEKGKSCVSVIFSSVITVDKVNQVLTTIHKKYTNKHVTCHIAHQGKEHLMWFSGNPKTLRAEYTMELLEDLNPNGINMQEEIVLAMANEIKEEIDREILRGLYDGADTHNNSK